MVAPTTCGCGLHCAPPRGAGSSTAGGRCQGRGGSSGGRCSAGVARATTGSPSYCAPGSSGGEVLCFCKTAKSLVKEKCLGFLCWCFGEKEEGNVIFNDISLLVVFWLMLNIIRFVFQISLEGLRKSLSETEFLIFCQNIINHLQKAHFIK